MNQKKNNSNNKKKTAYVSLNFIELQILKDNGAMEAPLMYLLLKKRANFKTGIVKGFNGHKLTYVELAQDMCRPASQGKAAVIVTSQQARDMIGRMVNIGLVTDVKVDNGELTLRLPLSPIEYGKEVETAKQEVAIGEKLAASGKFKQGTTEKLPDLHSGFFDEDDTPSVLSFSSTNSTKSLNTVSHETGEGIPSPDVASNVYPHPVLEEANPKSTQSQNQVNSFAQLLADRGFEMAMGSLSRTFYERWAKAGVSVEQVADAADAVALDCADSPLDRLVPLLVDKKLSAGGKRRSTGRGKVAV